MATDHTREFTADSFRSALQHSNTTPVLVDFWAPWCPPCRVLGPTIDTIAERFEGDAVVGKVNVDELPELAAEYAVQSIPTVIVFKDGKPAARFTGIQSEQTLAAALQDAAPATA
jgi:thioredoxin 1